MPLTGFYILGVGVLIGFLAFALGAINMGRHMQSFSPKSDVDPFSSFGKTAKGHVGAMVGLAFGGLIGVIGIIVAIMNALTFYG